jgi:hypothetical protein
MEDERKVIRERRARLRKAYGELYDELSRLLFDTDPMRINFGDNTDEYEPEVDTILPRLAGCQGKVEVQAVLYEEFSRWFGAEEAATVESYPELAERVWELALKWRRQAGPTPKSGDT